MRNAILLLAAALAASGRLPAAESAEMALTAGRSLIVDYAADIGRISTSNPDVVDAVAVSTREVLLNAKQPGAATIVVWAKTGTRSAYAVSVEPNLDPVRDLLKQTFPGYAIEPHAARDALSLTGTVPTQAASERAAALVAPFAKVVVNNLVVSTGVAEKQVLLKVRFAELNRSASSAFGVNLLSLGGANTLGLTGTGQFQSARPDKLAYGPILNDPPKFTISDALNVFAFRPDLNLGAFIKALQNKNLLQILAEPNLVTTDGKEASFLVGGEFPVPIVQGGANAGAVTIVFKEFGIRLSFLPSLTDHGTIRMHVKPEVSAVDAANSVLYSGFTIPALSTRRMETNIELGEGQSFVIAGLIDARVTEVMSKMPGLSGIPILGALFKSRQEQKTNNELIVMVTPEITAPLNREDPKPSPPMPKEFLAPAADAGAQGSHVVAGKTAKEKK
ncbi:MAG TPA: pilus assembly protein N-terminal domain-containing protein [Bryobacteraceae bacterium]